MQAKVERRPQSLGRKQAASHPAQVKKKLPIIGVEEHAHFWHNNLQGLKPDACLCLTFSRAKNQSIYQVGFSAKLLLVTLA